MLRNSGTLSKLFSWMAIRTGFFFAFFGITFHLRLILPVWVTAIAGVQAFWWLVSFAAKAIKTA
jgi:hypothetical protein